MREDKIGFPGSIKGPLEGSTHEFKVKPEHGCMLFSTV